MIYKNDDSADDDDNHNSYEQDMINKAAGYMISKYIYEIKKFKIDSTTTTKPIPIQDYFYNLIKNLVLNDKEFHNYTFDNYKIHFRYNEEKDMFYYIRYN
jgi:hypothetical protein